MVRAIHYAFSQILGVPAQEAFEWCTGYTPEDHALMNEENAVREIRHISEDTIILTDKYFDEGKSIVKQKLVCLYPTRLMWTSTHLKGPNKHSQFLYEIVPESSQQCHLKFTALHLDYKVKEETNGEKLCKVLLKQDSEIWKQLAEKMMEDFKKT